MAQADTASLAIKSTPVLMVHVFFIGLAVLFIAIWAWRATDFYYALHKDLHYRGEIALRNMADQLAGTLDGHFHDLTFFRRSSLELDKAPFLPTPEKRAAMIAFQKTHPEIAAINLLDAHGEHVVWSSEGQSTTPLLKVAEFQKLTRNPDYLIGIPVLLADKKTWVLPMREHLLDSQGRLLGYIGSRFLLSGLRAIDTPRDMDIVVMSAGRVPVAFWQSAVWQSPTSMKVWTTNHLQVPIPGYPWVAYARLAPSAFMHAYWHRIIRQGIPFLFILLILLVLDRLAVRFLRQLLELRRYQQVALLTQQSLLVQSDPAAMYASLVQTIVRETHALAAFMVVPDMEAGTLQIVALEADQAALGDSLRRWLLALNQKRILKHSFLPVRVFHTGCPEETSFSEEFGQLSDLLQEYPELQRMQSMIAYPIRLQEEQRAEMVLVVARAEAKYFHQALKNLLGQLASSLGLGLTLWKRHHALSEAEREIRKVAFYDSLTGLANRRLLNSRLEMALTSASQNGASIALGILDVDDFKKVNDQYGHEAGDALLVVMARRLEDALKPTDCIARWGGDEFVLLLQGIPDLNALNELLLRLERTLDSPAKLAKDLLLPIRVSMGVCFCSVAGQVSDPAGLMRLADQALYAAKARKSDRPHFWMIYDQIPTESEAQSDTPTH